LSSVRHNASYGFCQIRSLFSSLLDSRYFGFVDAATVLGKPILIYNSIDRATSYTLNPQRRGRVRWNRLFRIVR